MDRVIEKLDSYYSKNDYDGAFAHLSYWIKEAENSNDSRSLISLYNEKMGICRKTGRRDEGFAAADGAMKLVEDAGLSDSVSGATVYINAATVYTAFNEKEKAVSLFEKARSVFESKPDADPGRLASLYNNMATALADLGRFEEALTNYTKALEILEKVQDSEPEQAITKLNMANVYEAQLGLEEACEKIDACLDEAEKLLDNPITERDGRYAFVCTKCAPVYGYYGRFAYAETLKERAKEIYEGD